MRKLVALFAIVIAFGAAMTPAAMANVRAFHLCCPPQATQPQHAGMEHCGGMPPGSTAGVKAEMQDCSRHMLSTAAPGVVHPATQAIVGRPAASHPILDEFIPLFAPGADQSSQKDRAPPTNGQ